MRGIDSETPRIKKYFFVPMDWRDSNQIYSTDLLSSSRVFSDEELLSSFSIFLSSFTLEGAFVYREKRRILIEHLASYDSQLYNQLVLRPEHFISLVNSNQKKFEFFGTDFSDFQFFSEAKCKKVRELDGHLTNKLVKIRGIVVSASSVEIRAKQMYVVCKSCLEGRLVPQMLRSCKAECGLDPFMVIPEKSLVVDSQIVKIQEEFDDIPSGEVPRHLSLIMEGALVNQVSPGQTIEAYGIFSVSTGANGTFSFLRVTGLGEEKIEKVFTEEEKLKFKEMSKNIHEILNEMIAPSVHGHDDVKKTLAAQLFGGTRRILKDSTLRGDINVLLIGDPGIAKSQMLKNVSEISPISVYTSGKGSSAAGLTASVIRGRKGEFYLEGGALVLGDGGICCIDEFDKMEEKDRVAIHEAMEQQTISIAKAGITTMLNTRTSILAAANPKFGRYDDYKTPQENIEFGVTILSRFDFIFILRDSQDKKLDQKLAHHVLNLHRQKPTTKKDPTLLKRYISYAKKIEPTLTPQGREKLQQFYITTRQTSSSGKFPITVRQLEAVIRMSEAQARMELKREVEIKHVNEAIRLFQVSTLNAVQQGYYLEGMNRSEVLKDLNQIIESIKNKMKIGITRKIEEIKEEIKEYKPENIFRTIEYMVKREMIEYKDNGRSIVLLPHHN